jgi:hypothetical protein
VSRSHSARSATALALVLAAMSACTAPDEPRTLVCADPAKVVSLRDTHFPDESCRSATKLAETRLTMAFYRKACQQLAPSAGLPSRVAAAAVTSCEPATHREDHEGGVVAQIEICCL